MPGSVLPFRSTTLTRNRFARREPRRVAATGPDGPSGDKPGAQLRLDDPVQTVVWGGQVLNTRRAVLGTLTAAAVALGGNLGGVTSRLLAVDGGATAARLRLDIIVPVNGFRRCADFTEGYEFLYPAEWLGDQTIALRKAQRAEAQRALDPPPLNRRRRDVVEPSAAFGPAGSSGEENVSVVVAPIAEGFELSSLGAPEQAAARFLETIAPPSSPLTATLLAAAARVDEAGQQYYELEYQVQGPTFFRHNLSTYTARDNKLFTFNAQVPESAWSKDGQRLKMAAASFRLLRL